jgi:hypothetical protein
MKSPVLISILSDLCGRALLGFPALAGQEYGAWTLVLATGVGDDSATYQANWTAE